MVIFHLDHRTENSNWWQRAYPSSNVVQLFIFCRCIMGLFPNVTWKRIFEQQLSRYYIYFKLLLSQHCGPANSQQLRRQSFISRWTSLVKLSSGPTAQSRHHSWRDIFFRKHEHSALWLLICGALEKHLLTCLLTFKMADILGNLDSIFNPSHKIWCTAVWKRTNMSLSKIRKMRISMPPCISAYMTSECQPRSWRKFKGRPSVPCLNATDCQNPDCASIKLWLLSCGHCATLDYRPLSVY